MKRVSADQISENPYYPPHPWSIPFLSLIPLSGSELASGTNHWLGRGIATARGTVPYEFLLR